MASDPGRDERSILAAEYLLGLLEGAELDRARTLERDDPDFARSMERWAVRFEALADQWPEVAPSPALQRRIEAALGFDSAANDNPARPWKWATGISSALAAALAIALLIPRAPEPAPPPAVPAQAPTMAVVFDVSGGEQRLPGLVDLARNQVRMPRGIEVPQGRVAELWLIEGENPPQPLGLFEPTANGFAATVTIPRDLPAGATLAISIEPTGGSPTGQPTGPVVATGELRPI